MIISSAQPPVTRSFTPNTPIASPLSLANHFVHSAPVAPLRRGRAAALFGTAAALLGGCTATAALGTHMGIVAGAALLLGGVERASLRFVRWRHARAAEQYLRGTPDSKPDPLTAATHFLKAMRARSMLISTAADQERFLAYGLLAMNAYAKVEGQFVSRQLRRVADAVDAYSSDKISALFELIAMCAECKADLLHKSEVVDFAEEYVDLNLLQNDHLELGLESWINARLGYLGMSIVSDAYTLQEAIRFTLG